jgi:hypothetical protein
MKFPFLKLIPAVFFLFLIQKMEAQHVGIGVYGGPVWANMNISPQNQGDPEGMPLPGLQFGVFSEIEIVPHFSLQPELMYSIQGTQYNKSISETIFGTVSTYKYEGKIRLNTLEIPLLAKLNFGRKILKFHLLAGPSFGIGLSGEKNSHAFGIKTTPDGLMQVSESNEKYDAGFVLNKFDATDYDQNTQYPFSKFNTNMHLGAGLNLNLGLVSLFLEGRYILGLSDLLPEGKDIPAAYSKEGKSTRIGISAGVMFAL